MAVVKLSKESRGSAVTEKSGREGSRSQAFARHQLTVLESTNTLR